jgi:hypothetical protein
MDAVFGMGGGNSDSRRSIGFKNSQNSSDEQDKKEASNFDFSRDGSNIRLSVQNVD